MLEIARVALERNSRSGVTGYLYYDDEAFVQALEGMEADVDAIYASIRRDYRHTDVQTLADEAIASRLFGNWAMGFHDGSETGGLLARSFGDGIARKAGPRDAPALTRFLKDLSLGRSDVRQLAPGAL